MSHSLSLSQTALKLQVSKSKLYSLIRELGVVPKNRGNKKLVDANDIEKMRVLLESEGHQQSLFSNSRNQSKSADDVSSDQKNTHVEALIREKDKSIERLEKQLSEANLQNNRFMESIVGLQKQMSNLNQRLLLNEPSESVKPNIMEVQVERSSESEDGVLVNEVPPETFVKNSRNFLSPLIWLVLLGVAVISAYELGGGSLGEIFRNSLASN